ncbi:MAG: cytochrome oxidase small assembly protein [Gammaproteobacteria bacterium]
MEQRNDQTAKNLRTALALATIALAFFLGFLLRRYFFG